MGSFLIAIACYNFSRGEFSLVFHYEHLGFPSNNFPTDCSVKTESLLTCCWFSSLRSCREMALIDIILSLKSIVTLKFMKSELERNLI